MAAIKGRITSLGDYTTITTTSTQVDSAGREHTGIFDRQKEHFINGLTIGDRTFGRVSCPENIYMCLESDKEAILYTLRHPFLGWPPIRLGIVGIAYPQEQRAFVISKGQVLLNLIALGLLPIFWVLPAIVIGGIADGIIDLPSPWDMLVVILIALSPWIAAIILVYNYIRLRLAFPYARVPNMI
jgi:hypothetical protein